LLNSFMSFPSPHGNDGVHRTSEDIASFEGLIAGIMKESDLDQVAVDTVPDQSVVQLNCSDQLKNLRTGIIETHERLLSLLEFAQAATQEIHMEAMSLRSENRNLKSQLKSMHFAIDGCEKTAGTDEPQYNHNMSWNCNANAMKPQCVGHTSAATLIEPQLPAKDAQVSSAHANSMTNCLSHVHLPGEISGVNDVDNSIPQNVAPDPPVIKLTAVVPEEELQVLQVRRSARLNSSKSISALDHMSTSHHLLKLPSGYISKSKRPFRRSVFADVDALKQKVREASIQPKSLATDLYSDTGIFQAIARSTLFENITLAVIALNSVWLAVDTSINNEALLTDAPPICQVMEAFFCIYFMSEAGLRFMAYKTAWDCLRDAWFVFDSLLAMFMLLETWGLTLFLLLVPGTSGLNLAGASTLRLVRLLRLTRMARMAKLLHAMPELMFLIKGLAVATRSVGFTLFLMLILIYMFAIAFTQLAKGTPLQAQFFPSVEASMGTLLLSATVPDLVDMIKKDLATEHILFAIFFFIFILLASLTIMNMLIGVLVEVVSVVSAVEKEQLDVYFVKSTIESMLATNDYNGNNCFDKAEFEALLENREAVQCLQKIGVDVVGLVDFADCIFRDAKYENQQLTTSDFMELALQMRGTNKATVKDIVDMRKFILKELTKIESTVLWALKDKRVGENNR